MQRENKGALFDLDGVLIDKRDYHLRSWYDLAEKTGYQMTEELFLETFGMQNSQIVPLLAGEAVDEQTIAELSEWKEARYRELIAGELKLLPGAVELLKDLRANGFKTAIGTSTPKVNLEFMLEQTQAGPLFDAYVSAEDVENSKPAPDTFTKAGEKLGLTPSSCVVIEDALPGVQSGKNAGMKVIAVTSTRTAEELREVGPDLIVSGLDQLTAADFETLLEPLQAN